MNPIHPALAPLAQTAKVFAREIMTTGHVVDLMTPLRQAVGQGRGWLRPEHRVGDPARYMRHIVYVDPEDAFVITAITWLPGQQSPVHGHYVWCAFGVAEGELTEERFRAPDFLEPIGIATLRAGDTAELDLGGPIYHRVSNRTRAPLVTLHVYGVAASAITTGINRVFADE
ncbi:MAG TPA: cysteine dioxygenase family protein [Burkholderiales bacterium]|jgi:predicted metal-dependent enzyme (double-stranded beta helix superfamily)|nr:cysteine dioxygenase family protein [Burkholderiales bacterium]